jgi:hypothetical protein
MRSAFTGIVRIAKWAANEALSNKIVGEGRLESRRERFRQNHGPRTIARIGGAGVFLNQWHRYPKGLRITDDN